ncbi:MAG TPA: alpha/beta hydrolase [Xanthomonadaceae bacterium]|jgi:arylformamidase|nr:alpha/beta hydrolase [Xanthomonadaceae bacterium]
MRKSARHTLLALASGIALAVLAIPQVSHAGPLRDAIMQRRAAAQGDDGMLGEGDRGPANLPAGINIVRNVAYGNAMRQRFDVYAPQQTHNAPVIFLVHGGAWMIGDKTAKNVIEGKVGRWVPRGFIVISVDYRMLPEAPVSEQAQDVASALAYAQQHAASWGGDPRRFILMGHSAGAHLVSLITADTRIAQEQGASPWLGTVALDSAAYDVAEIMQGQHARFYDRVFGSDPSVWAADSPTQRLDGQILPFLAACSSRRQKSCPQAQRFVDKAGSFGTRIQLVEENKTHEEINKDLGVDPAYTAQVEAFMRGLDPSVASLLNH